MTAAMHNDTRQPADAEQLLGWACAVEHANACCEYLERETPEDWTGGYSADGCAVLAERARIGARIQGGGMVDRAQCSEDAALVYLTARYALRDEPRTFRLVVECARRRSPPDIDPVAPLTPYPAGELVEYKGEARKLYGGMKEGGVVIQYDGPGCPIHWHDNCRLLDKARQEYIAWFQAMRRLEFALMAEDHNLKRWRVVRLRAKPRPWEG